MIEVTILTLVLGFFAYCLFADFEKGFYCLIILSVVDGILKKIRPDFWPLLFAKDLILITLYIKFFIFIVLRRRALSNLAHTTPIIGFMGFCALMLLVPSNNSFIIKLAGLRELIFYIPLIFFANYVFNTKSAVRRFWMFSIYLGLITSGIGIIQFYATDLFSSLVGPGFSEAVWLYSIEGTKPLRVFSTLTDPAALSIHAAITLFMLIFSRSLLKRDRFLFFAIPICLYCLFLTGTRTTMIAFLLLIILFFLRQYGSTREKIIFSLVIVLSVFLIVIINPKIRSRYKTVLTPFKEFAFTERLKMWQSSIKSIQDSPMGKGLGASSGLGDYFRDKLNADQLIVDNAYFRVNYEIGPIGLFLFLILLASIWLQIKNAHRAIGDVLLRRFASVCVYSYFLILIVGVANNGAFVSMPAAYYFWALCGIVPRLKAIRIGFSGKNKLYQDERFEEKAHAFSLARQ